jgi:hypothetical protein
MRCAQTWCTTGCRKARTFRNDGWTEGRDKLFGGLPHLLLLGFERLAAELHCRGTLLWLLRLPILLLVRVVWEQFQQSAVRSCARGGGEANGDTERVRAHVLSICTVLARAWLVHSAADVKLVVIETCLTAAAAGVPATKVASSTPGPRARIRACVWQGRTRAVRIARR